MEIVITFHPDPGGQIFSNSLVGSSGFPIARIQLLRPVIRLLAAAHNGPGIPPASSRTTSIKGACCPWKAVTVSPHLTFLTVNRKGPSVTGSPIFGLSASFGLLGPFGLLGLLASCRGG